MEQFSVTMNEFEQRVMSRSLNEFRNVLIREDYPTDDVDRILLRVIDAPSTRRKWRNRDEI